MLQRSLAHDRRRDGVRGRARTGDRKCGRLRLCGSIRVPREGTPPAESVNQTGCLIASYPIHPRSSVSGQRRPNAREVRVDTRPGPNSRGIGNAQAVTTAILGGHLPHGLLSDSMSRNVSRTAQKRPQPLSPNLTERPATRSNASEPCTP